MRNWVKGNDQTIRELIAGPLLSDEARNFYIDALTAIAEEIGVSAFQALMGKVIATCERRPTIATFRRMAGLCMDEPSPAVTAWILVTDIVTRHLGQDGNGMAVLEPKTRLVDGLAVEEPVPEISAAVKRAVGAMGGWTSLADSYPDYWGRRFMDFKEIYRPDAGTQISTK